MILNRESVVQVITTLVNANPNLLEKIYLTLEKKGIPKNRYYEVLSVYREKVLDDVNKFRFDKYFPFFPVLTLFEENNDIAEINDELSISLDEHVAFGSLALANDRPETKKFANQILWDLSKNSTDRSRIQIQYYRKFYDQIKTDKSLLELIKTLGGTSLNESSNNSNSIEDERYQLNIPSEFHSITQSDDLRNLFYLELINLKDKDLEIIFYKKLIDKSLMTYVLGKLSNVKIPQQLLPSNKQRFHGSVVIAIDTSGSMLGVKEIISKYIAYLITEICLPLNREVVLISYSIDYFYFKINPQSPFQSIQHQLEEFLNTSYYGGTGPISALKQILKIMNTTENLYYSDILLISDFIFKDPTRELKKNKLYQDFQERQNRIIGLEISTTNVRKKILPEFVDEHYIYFFNWIKEWTREDWSQYFKIHFSENTYLASEMDPKYDKPYYGFLRKVFTRK